VGQERGDARRRHLRGARCGGQGGRDQAHHRAGEPARVPGRGAAGAQRAREDQLYLQRYIQHFPAAGEIVIFDRSWYNRAGVERVMGFCTDAEYERFLEVCPEMEHYFIESGIMLIKYWFDVGMEEQSRRFQSRIEDPRKIWKLSPMDVASYARWYQYSKARDRMLEATDTDHAPWHIVRSDSKKRARLNCISHLLGQIPYKDLTGEKVDLGKRSSKGKYDDQASLEGRRFVPEKY
jgi:polyphosphate kinase 2